MSLSANRIGPPMMSPSLAIAVSLVLSTAVIDEPARADDAKTTGAAARDGAAVVRQERPNGLTTRTPWTTSRISGSPEPPLPYRIERCFPELQFQNPVVLTSAPGTDRLFVAELAGKIYSFPNDSRARADLAIDLQFEIAGLKSIYGFTFHPQFASNRLCYVTYVLGEDNPAGTRVSRFRVSRSDPPRIDPASEELVISWLSGGHNGGCLKFGPEGYLYISTGDGGPAFPPDPRQSGQDVSNLLSSILRIDVDRRDAERNYHIPADNPFVQLEGARGEVWAYGFRNPWRMSFDPATGDLWVGDVGWELWEMVYRVDRGANYGWSLVEGRQPVHRERTRGPTPIVPPTIEHSHIEARSITGGCVYRGQRLKELAGAYVYGDYVTGKIWAARHDGSAITWHQELVDTPLQIICFGVDRHEELYVVDYAGTIHRLVPNPAPRANLDFPRKLSDTGLFASTADYRIAPGVIPYSVNAEPWADHAVADRLVALPGTTQLGVYKDTNVQIGYIEGEYEFPSDAVLVKTVSLPVQQGDAVSLRRVETQVLHRDVDTWRGYSYVWNDEQTDAVLADPQGRDLVFNVPDPQTGAARPQTWHVPSRSECILCHTTRAGSVHGFRTPQLNKDHDYGGVIDNQLRALSHIGLFREPIPDVGAKIPSPADQTESLQARARAYLHINCAHCHRRGGGGTAAIEVPFDLPLSKTNLLDARPTQGTFGIHAAQVLTPGDPYRSVLYYRMAKLGRGRMPYFGSSEVDQAGLKLIYDWIESLSPSGPDGGAAAVAESHTERRQQELGLLQSLIEADPRQAERVQELTGELLATTTGALLVLHAIDVGQLDQARQAVVLPLATTHVDPQVRDLFERFVPESQRVKRLGTIIQPGEILVLRGDAERGRELFHTAAGVLCRNCHRVNGAGRALGPDLDQIGKKYDRPQLLESILEPSKAIDPKFLTYLVETKRGLIHSGVLVRRNESSVVLRDAQAVEVEIPTQDVALIAPQQKSMMPELLLQDLTAEQVADLLEYLASLKEPAN